MLKDSIKVLYDDLTSKIGSPRDLKEVIENKDTIELGQAVEIPQNKPDWKEPKAAAKESEQN